MGQWVLSEVSVGTTMTCERVSVRFSAFNLTLFAFLPRPR